MFSHQPRKSGVSCLQKCANASKRSFEAVGSKMTWISRRKLSFSTTNLCLCDIARYLCNSCILALWERTEAPRKGTLTLAPSRKRARANVKWPRSEERRVGKEGRSRWLPYH